MFSITMHPQLLVGLCPVIHWRQLVKSSSHVVSLHCSLLSVVRPPAAALDVSLKKFEWSFMLLLRRDPYPAYCCCRLDNWSDCWYCWRGDKWHLTAWWGSIVCLQKHWNIHHTWCLVLVSMSTALWLWVLDLHLPGTIRERWLNYPL